MKKIVVFASGGGSSVENLYLYFSKKPNVEVLKLYCNNPEAGVLKRNTINSLEKLLFNNDELNSDKILSDLENLSPDLIVLAGFLKKIPEKIVNLFRNKIINIHPSLLPKYKGLDTFNRVLKAKEKITGCTVHYVTDKLDSGKIILKKKINILPGEDSTKLKIKVQNQEYKAYSEAIYSIYR